MATAASTPMIATTIISSTSVKPRLRATILGASSNGRANQRSPGAIHETGRADGRRPKNVARVPNFVTPPAIAIPSIRPRGRRVHAEDAGGRGRRKFLLSKYEFILFKYENARAP